MSWLVKTANLSSLKDQLSTLAKDVLADVEEAVQEAVKEEEEQLGNSVRMKDWSQDEFVTSSSRNQIAVSENERDDIAAVEDEKSALPLHVHELQKSTGDADKQLMQLQRKNEVLELEVKILQSDKESFQQRVRSLEKYEKEVKDLRRQLAEIQENHKATEKQLKQDLEESRKNAEMKTNELASTELLVSSMKSEIEHLRRVNEDLETRSNFEVKKLLEEREAAERKVNELIEELASVRQPVLKEFSEDNKEVPLDYEDLFHKISYQIQVKASESAVDFARKLESFLKNMNNSELISKSSVDELEVAQLFADDEFSIVEVPKETSEIESPLNSENATTKNDMISSTDFVSPTESEKYEVQSQTEVSLASEAGNQTDSDGSSVSTHDAQTGSQNEIDQTESVKDIEDSSSQTLSVVHDKSDVVCQTEVDLDSQENQTDIVVTFGQSTLGPFDGFSEDVTSLTDFKGMNAVSQTEDRVFVQVQQSTECDSLVESTSCQTDLTGVYVTSPTETVQLNASNRAELTMASDQLMTYESNVTSSGCQTETVDITELLQSARPILNSLYSTPYGTVAAKLEAELEKILSVDQTFAQFLDLMLATYRQINEDMEATLILKSQVEKFQNERNQLIQALKQKHEESINYHSEIQKLSKTLQEYAKKRQNVVDAAVQFNGMSDLEEEVTQLREVEALLTAEAINLKQTIEQIRNRHKQEILGLKETISETEKKLENANRSRQKMEQKFTKRLNTLQHALDAIHKEKEIEIQEATHKLRKHLECANQEKQNLRQEMATLEVQVRELEGRLADGAELSNQLLERNETIARLQMELERNEKQQNELREEMGRLTSSSVDRYLVANLVCGYIIAPLSDKQKVLNLLSTVLSFTTEEKIKCGLVEQQQTLDAKSLSAAFLQFLEAESKPRPKLPSLLP